MQPLHSHGAAGDAASGQQYLTFSLADETFAVDILNVREIISYGQLTAVPMAPDSVRGVINLRGAVVPVIDLRRRFGQASSDVGQRTCIVIVEIRHDTDLQIVGIMVDAVNEVLEIDQSHIETPPAFGAHMPHGLLEGMAKQAEGFILLLALSHVLDFPLGTPQNQEALALTAP